jgi:glutamate-ammonia-ligase adenylyltransferase
VLRKERPAGGPLKQEVIAMRKRMMDAKPNHAPCLT